jgi:hypothetical protein
VPANGHAQAERFNRQAAHHEDGTLCGGGKQDQSGYGKKKSGGHDQQSGIFHGLLFEFLSKPFRRDGSERQAKKNACPE